MGPKPTCRGPLYNLIYIVICALQYETISRYTIWMYPETVPNCCRTIAKENLNKIWSMVVKCDGMGINGLWDETSGHLPWQLVPTCRNKAGGDLPTHWVGPIKQPHVQCDNGATSLWVAKVVERWVCGAPVPVLNVPVSRPLALWHFTRPTWSIGRNLCLAGQLRQAQEARTYYYFLSHLFKKICLVPGKQGSKHCFNPSGIKTLLNLECEKT